MVLSNNARSVEVHPKKGERENHHDLHQEIEAVRVKNHPVLPTCESAGRRPASRPLGTPGDCNYVICEMLRACVRCHRTSGNRPGLGAAALDLAFVAAGRLDGFWEDELSPWDIAAGGLIVRESGGYATDMQGGKDAVYNGNILAANPQIHSQLVQLVGGRQEKTATA